MLYQESDKELVARYLTANVVSGEITSADLHIKCPVWMAIRTAYYEDAVKWQRELNQRYKANCMANNPKHIEV